jgi:hypothetical protein
MVLKHVRKYTNILEGWPYWGRIFSSCLVVDCVWNVMAHAQKPDFVFRRNGRVHLNRQGRQFSRLLAGELCASAVVMLDTPCSEVLFTHSIHQLPLHFPSRASPCVITFQLDSTSDIPLSVSLSACFQDACPRDHVIFPSFHINDGKGTSNLFVWLIVGLFVDDWLSHPVTPWSPRPRDSVKFWSSTGWFRRIYRFFFSFPRHQIFKS